MAIDREILERLLIDRALRELSPDAQALLEDYLAREPEASEEAEEIARTVDAARCALARSEEVNSHSLPPLLLGKRGGILWRVGARAAVLAACLLIGVGVGLWFSQSKQVIETQVEIAWVGAEEESDGTEEANRSEIWSARRFYEAASRPARTKRARLIWDSPTKMPRLEERT